MKTWKMVASLVMLLAIICGCALVGRSVEVSAAPQDPTEEQQPKEDLSVQEKEEAEEPEQPQGGSVTVEKVYSRGLYFRSNGDGTCALAGLGSGTASLVVIPPQRPAGDTVTEILPYALANSIVGAVEIPTTVTTLSSAAFSGCPRLSYVSVASGNASFLEWDGLLYTADGSTLLYCPAARAGTQITLHASLRRIAAGAFGECTRLTAICYPGSAAQWHGVIVGGENDPLYAASLRFNA